MVSTRWAPTRGPCLHLVLYKSYNFNFMLLISQSLQISFLYRLVEGQPTHSSSFSIFETFDLPSIFLCHSKALEVSKIGRSGRITEGLKILKSNFAQNITSNIIFRLPEGQPTHSSPFSIFDTFDLPSIFLCLN